MSGRGSSSRMSGGGSGASRMTGLDVTKDGEITRYYFTSHNGENYYQRGISGTLEPTPLNMSAKEFRQRVESNGATTKSISNAEYRKAESAYRKERDNIPDYELGVGLKDNSAYRKTARRNRIINRTMKKR